MIGSFLSAKTGTKSISEKLVEKLKCESINFIIKSKYKNKILRLVEIFLYTLFANYDIIHIDTFSGDAFRISEVASIIARFRKRKIILTLHGGKLPEFYIKYPGRVKRVLNRADYLLTPSKYLQNFFKVHNIEIQYLPNSLDLLSFPYNRSFVIPHSLLWVRAFSEIYNPQLPVLILYEIRKTFPDATLTMVGPDKGLFKKVKKLIKNLNLEEYVKITGPVKNDELFKFYHTHDVFLNTTSYESFGVAVLEAAACGIPIVSTKVGEIPLLWKNEVNILLAEQIDTSSFVKQISRLFTDTELSNTLSINGRKNAEQFDWNLLKNNWIKLFS